MSVDSTFSRFNPVVVSILRSPFHWLLSPGLALLSYVGRVSGRKFTIPVGYQLRDDEATVMVSEAQSKQWWRNFREPADVSIRIRGEPKPAAAPMHNGQIEAVAGADRHRTDTVRRRLDREDI